MSRTGQRSIAGLAASFPLAGEACAHGLGQRYDLPLPLGLYLLGAAAAVAVSFLFLVFFHRPREAGAMPGEKPIASGTIAPAVAVSLQVLSVSALALIVAAGFFGQQSPFKNIAPVAVWVIWWVGTSYVSAFLGNVWAIINPWSALFGWADTLARKWRKRGLSLGLRYPPRLGRWPAVALFLLFAWTELIASGRDVPRNIAGAIAAYSLLTWTGFVLFGRETWRKSGETFAVAFALFGRFAPLRVTQTGERWQWALRPHAVGLLTRAPLPPAQIAFVLVMLATVTFDGILETPAWAAVLEAVGGGDGTEPLTAALLSSFGFCATPILFAAVYFGVVVLMARMARSAGAQVPSVPALAGLFVLSLVPIAIAYHLAHYLSLLLVAGQFIIPLASDPFGWGWDLFGTTLYRIDLSVVNARFVWYTAVTAIVTGHIIAVWLSHEVAAQLFPDARQLRRSQYPMMLLMVGYTALSLWILAQPIVEIR